MITKDLGIVTAYGYAVSKGYTGTEEEFAELMASYATVAERAAQSASTASEKAQQAAQAVLDAVAAKEAAVQAKNDAVTAKTSAQDFATSASQSAQSASGSASSASQSAGAAQAFAESAAGSATAASQSAADANTAKTDAENAKEDAETAQGKAEEAQAKSEEAQGKAEDAVVEAEAILANKANIDGYYQDMTVGDAEQLLATVGNEDSVPYNFRTSGGSIDIGDREEDMVVGGTVVWNQLAHIPLSDRTKTENGVTITDNRNGTYTVSTDANGASEAVYISFPTLNDIIKDHKYLFKSAPSGGSSSSYYSYVVNTGIIEQKTDFGNGVVVNGLSNGTVDVVVFVAKNAVITTPKIFIPQLFDLTQMFGSTIANYIYSLEQANAGAGVAWFKKLFPKDYYEYNAGELMSVKTSAHKMVGFNAFDVESGTAKLVGGMQYQITGTYTSLSLDGETITPDSSGYFTPSASGTMTVTGGGSNTCIHLVWDGERDGEYEEYVEHVYPLDSSVELRGIPKLDSANNLYYDGDTYESDGTVTRKYGIVELTGAEQIIMNTTTGFRFFDVIIGAKKAVQYLRDNTMSNVLQNNIEKTTGVRYQFNFSGDLRIMDNLDGTFQTVADLRSYLTTAYNNGNPITIIYELATPTTETAEPFQNPQIVSNFGTEEYADDRAVPVPVGHETVYLPNLRAKLESAPDSPDADGEYIMKQTSGANEYIALGSSATIQGILEKLPNPPSSDGTYTLKVTVTNGTASYSWEA